MTAQADVTPGEDETGMPDGSPTAAQRAYFEDQFRSNREFWKRIGNRPDFTGKTVLDVGCGFGAMSVEVGREGAQVLGIDIDESALEATKRLAAEVAPELTDRVSFRVVDIAELDLVDHFDLALSKDTFEHVEDMPAMLQAIRRLLKPGGELWAGFSPLYYSPWGDHGRTGLRAPWAHAALPRRLVLRSAARYQRHPVRRLADIGLNGMTPAEFRGYVDASGLQVVSLQYNRGDKRLLRALDLARRVPRLEPWATVGIYTVLRRPA